MTPEMKGELEDWERYFLDHPGNGTPRYLAHTEMLRVRHDKLTSELQTDDNLPAKDRLVAEIALILAHGRIE